MGSHSPWHEDQGSEDVGSAVAAIRAGVDTLADLDPESVDGAGLLGLVTGLHREFNRLGATVNRLAVAYHGSEEWAEQGFRSGAAHIAYETRMSLPAARGLVHTGRSLSRMPLVDTSLFAGRMSLAHVAVLARLANNSRIADAFTASEKQLVEWAETLQWAEFIQVITYWHHCADPDGTEKAADDDLKARSLRISDGLDGVGFVDGRLDPLSRSVITNALEQIEKELFNAEYADVRDLLNRDPSISELPRTREQRMVDALVEMAQRAFARNRTNGHKPKPLITVLVDYPTFAGRICQMADGTPVTPGTAARLLPDAEIERVVFGPDKRVLDVGVTTRFFTGATRRAIEVRDLTCQFPGCTEPYERCDIDHIQPYSQGGLTTQTNGRLMCGPHNRARNHGHEPP